jgi:hypothetical protein
MSHKRICEHGEVSNKCRECNRLAVARAEQRKKDEEALRRSIWKQLASGRWRTS